MTTITGTITQPIQLGTGSYGETLTITSTEILAPTTTGAIALTAGPGLPSILINNAGQITGGARHLKANGGIGILVASPGQVTNSGTISGGGTDGSNGQSTGGAGVVLQAAATLSNTGSIFGGTASTGGNGVDLSSAASLANAGLIEGGAGGGVGVDLEQASTLTNHGTIAGGAGSGTGLIVGAGSTATNVATITGGYGSYHEGRYGGGNGVNVASGGTLTNAGTITGGGGIESRFTGHPGAAGVYLSGGTLINTGTLQGAAADFYTGPGLVIGSGQATNTGTIVGVTLYGGSVLNQGVIAEAIFNDFPRYGVTLDGGTLTNAGKITATVTLAPTDTTATLIIDPGASFTSTVTAQAGGVTILELAGTTAGTIGHLGTAYTGFDIIETATQSNWTLQQANTITAATELLLNGHLTVAGLLQDAGTVSIRPTGELTVASGGAARAASVALQGGTLTAGAGGHLAIGNSLSHAQPGGITVDAGGTITGYGTIAAGTALIDNGTILAQFGTAATGFNGLVITGPISGTGIINIGTNTVLEAGTALTVAKLAFLGPNDTLCLATTQPTTTNITGFSTNDTITLNNLTANTATYANNTLSLYEGTTLADQLTLTGPYTTANFALSTTNDNTTITYAPTTPALRDTLLAWHTPHG